MTLRQLKPPAVWTRDFAQLLEDRWRELSSIIDRGLEPGGQSVRSGVAWRRGDETLVKVASVVRAVLLLSAASDEQTFSGCPVQWAMKSDGNVAVVDVVGLLDDVDYTLTLWVLED